MMPEDLWKPLSEQEIRSLVAYLASPAQVALPAAEGEGNGPLTDHALRAIVVPRERSLSSRSASVE